MSKQNRIINNLFILFSKCIELLRINLMLKVGSGFIATGTILLGGGFIAKLWLNKTIVGGNSYTIKVQFSNGSSIFVEFLGGLLIITGIILCVKGLTSIRQSWRKKTFYFLKGLSNQSENLPLEALPKVARWYPPNPVKLSLNTEKPAEMEKELSHHLKIISEKVEQTESDEIYFAGLAKVPYLYMIGYGFRNAHSSITLLDHNHQAAKWFTLKDTDIIDLDLDIINEESIQPNNNGDIGVAIEFTCEIAENELPELLKEHSIKVRLNKIVSHNQIKSKVTLARIVDEIIKLLIRLNKRATTIHLFISAQSTLVFSLGRRYQDGMMGKIQIYNYNAGDKKYPWAFKIENNEIELIEGL